MTFIPRSYNTILAEMIAHVRAYSTVTDFNVGSVVRTALEAAALEDDEQYFQMVQLLAAFSIVNARGADLDARVKDYNIFRLPATASTGQGRYYDTTVVSGILALDASASTTSLILYSTEGFPVPGGTYVVRVGEGTSRVEDITVSAHSFPAHTLTLSSGLVYSHFSGERVSVVTGAVGRTVGIGSSVQAPATSTLPSVNFTTQANAYIVPGNYYSNSVSITATTTGKVGNISASRINKFTTSAPFSGAGFTNDSATGGGAEEERDEELIVRALEKIQALSRGTKVAIHSGAIGVQDPITGSRVVSASVEEDMVLDEVRVFIDDGTGLVPDVVSFPADNLAADSFIGATSITLSNADDFPSTGTILILSEGSNEAELITYVGNVNNILYLDSATVEDHATAAIVHLVEVITDAAEDAQRKFHLTKFPIVRTSEIVWKLEVGGIWTILVPDTEYVLNKGTGDLEIVDTGGVPEDTQLVYSASYYTNLIAEVQKVMEGDIDDAATYPGIKAAGVFLSVEAPTIKRISVVAALSTVEGVEKEDILSSVVAAVESYINTLKVGEDVILAKMISAAMSVAGASDITFIEPTNNIVVLEDEKPVAFNASGVSLVSIT